MASSSRLPYGSLARMAVVFRDKDNALVDPTTVLLKFSDPAGNVTSWVVQAGQIVKDAVGKYHAEVDTTLVGAAAGPGTWHGRWYATGTGLSSIDFQFLVDDSPLK